MDNLAEFVAQHISDDTTRLILDRTKWPYIDMELAVSCIESRRKLRGKVQEWYDEPGLIFPYKLSAEQCSSSATGRYKAALASRIAAAPFRLADLTGGLGVDTWFFSRTASEVLYNEMQEKLCKAAIHNFKTLKANNIHCTCNKAEPGGISDILGDFRPDIIYMDPARRGEGGKKVFLLEDCTPDVITLRDEIFGICRHVLLKLSPMADITMVCERLGRSCREVHVAATGGECKELLIWLDREWNEGYTINAVELSRHYGLDPESPSSFTFTPSQEKEAAYTLASEGGYLFEPGKALMKAGAFNLISKRFGISKLGQSTHYYFIDNESIINELLKYGKIFRIISSSKLDKRSIKTVSQVCPKAEVTARNIPMDTDTLRRKLGCSPSDTHHIFALRSDLTGPLLLVTERWVSTI